MSSIYKGPRPFFSDLAVPPFYNEHGRRIESWEEGYVPLPAMIQDGRGEEDPGEKRGQEEPDDNIGLDKHNWKHG